LNGEETGYLSLNPKGLAQFRYSRSWFRNGFALSPSLPIQDNNPVIVARPQPFGGLFGVFHDSLQEGFTKGLVAQALAEKGHDYFSLSILERLALVGNDGLGALTYHPELRFLPPREAACDLTSAFNYIQDYLDGGREGVAWLNRVAGALGGSRPKVFHRPPGDEGAEWIVKFPGEDDPPEMGVMEAMYNEAAVECGLELPEYRLFHDEYYGCRRFDRAADGGRLHMVSLGGLLETDMNDKTLEYAKLFRLSRQLAGADEGDLWRVYKWMAFNILAENFDDHLRNFAFIHDGNGWRLSPAYDLTYPAYPREMPAYHALKVRGKDIGVVRDDLVVLAREFSLDPREAARIYGHMEPIARALLEQVKKTPPGELKKRFLARRA
jgi:serine/threonine-protein kinase HipA